MKINCNQNEYDIKQGETIKNALKEEIAKSEEDIITCIYNNEVKSLDYKLENSGKVELLTYRTTEGKRVYVRGIMYVMSMAIDELYPNSHLTINYQLDNSMFCTFENLKITDETLEKISDRMKQIINENIPITKQSMTHKQAKEFYEKEKTIRGISQINTETKEEISLYYCNNYYNYFYGVMPVSTGYMKVFELVAYKHGFLLRYPSKKDPKKLKEFHDNKKLLSTLEEYETIHKTLRLNTIYRLNKSVEVDKGKETILLAEALHEKKISDIANEIIKKRKQNKNDINSRTIIITEKQHLLKDLEYS